MGKFLFQIKLLVERFPRMAALYRNLRDEVAFWENPQITPWGFSVVGNSAMALGTFEPKETAVVREILSNVDSLVNVGANVGYYCCHALEMGKEVIAFEPIHRNLRYLYRNVKDNGWSNVEIYPLAISDGVGVIEIFGGNTGASLLKGWAGTPENYVTLVPSSTLDRVLGERLRGKKVLVLVDIEGAEKRMLDGASLLLANDPQPVWVVEIATGSHRPSGTGNQSDFEKVFARFFQHGYEAFEIEEGMRPVTMAQVERVSAGHLKFASHNFLFRARRGPE